MDTEKRQGLVKRHEQIDARVWNQFFGAWWPLAPWSEMTVTYRADLGVDQGTVTVPYSHPCASVFRRIRDGVPAPITLEVNGVFVSGQVIDAQAEQAEETQAWHLTIQTDSKHAHSMMARPMAQSAADHGETQLRGFLGPVARQVIGLASSRTGLPTYMCVDGEGDPVDLVARTEDTVADVLAAAVAGSDLFVDVRMLLPGQELPGESAIERFAGPVEREWENAALDAGLWPHAEHHERLVDVAEGPNGVIPPFSWNGVASVNHLGEVLDEPTEGYVWVPFATQAPYIGSEYYEPDRPIMDGSRVITAVDLDSHAEKFPGWASFVTEWKPGAIFSDIRQNYPLHEAVKAGLLKLADGTVPSPELPWSELSPLLVDYVGLDDRYFTTPGVFAWRDGATWVLANSADMEVEKARRAANVNQRQTPGVLFHFYPERDRRGIIFSSVPGGGLKSWSATYSAPEGAMLIASAQLDEWTMNQMGLGTLPEQAVTGEQSATPVDASTMKNIPETVDQIDVDVQPQARLEGSDVAYHAAGGRVDIGKAGPFFYREKYLNLGNSGTINPVQQMAQEWSRAQGSTTVQLTPSGRGGAVFGDDIVGDDGSRIPGWKHGDRVSFVDGDTRISEVIVGWTLNANAGEPLEVSPILGREDNGVLAKLGERIRGAERTSKKTALSPPRRIPAKEIENRAEDVFVREESAWSERVRASVEAANQASAEAHAHSKRSSAFSAQSVAHSEQARAHSDQSAVHSDASWEFSQNSLDYSRESFDHAEKAGEWSDLSWEHSKTSAEHSDASHVASESASEASRQAGVHSGQAWDHSEVSRGYSEASSEASQQAGLHSEAASGHSNTAREHSDAAKGHSADANTASIQAGEYSSESLSHAEDAAGHSAESSGHSEASRQHSITAGEHSQTASGHSETARQHSVKSSEHSETSRGHSVTAGEHSEAAGLASQASHEASEVSRGHSVTAGEHSQAAGEFSETASGHSQAASGHSETARGHSVTAGEHSDAAAAASTAASGHSEASRGHSVTAKGHSEDAAGHSAAASAASTAAGEHSTDAQTAAGEAAGHSADASLASQDAAGHSTTAKGHSEAASVASTAASNASADASAHSGSAWDYSQLADQAATNAGESETDAAEWKRLAEVARSLAEQERDAAEQARDDAETARSLAEDARSAAEDGRADAEAARDRAEQARARSSASMAAAEMMRAQAEEARRLAENARELAETARGLAEDERSFAEDARDEAEGWRNQAEGLRDDAETARGLAEDERELAENARDDAEIARGKAEDERELAEKARGEAEGWRDDAERIRGLAEDERRLAEEERRLAEDERDAAETARTEAEDARDAAEIARTAAEDGRSDAEAARDRAEQARARSSASMAAAEMMRAQAEEARQLAENARELAENERAAAEDERDLAETARDEAEGFRDEAETKRSQAEGERREAEGFRDEAEGFRDDAETKRSQAEGERKDAELARGEAEQARKGSMASMAAAEMMRMQAEQSRALAEQERKAAELERADAEDARGEAETARDEAEDARRTADEHRSTAFNHMQDAFNANEGASQAAVDAALSAQSSAEKALEAQLVGWRKFVHPGPHGLTLDDDRVGVTIMPNGLSGEIYAKPSPSWAGEFFGKVYYENNTVQTIYSKVPHVASLVFGGGNTPVAAVEVDYRDTQRKGRNSREVLSTGWQVPANNTWYQYRSGQPWSVTVQHPTDFTAVFAVGWDAAGYGGSYSIQARVNDVPVRTVKNTGFGPQFFWQGGGFRTQLLDLTGANALHLNGGDTVSFWVIRERNGNTVVPGERKIREFSLRVTWSEPES